MFIVRVVSTRKDGEMERLQKHNKGDNGIDYTLGSNGLYYPDLVLEGIDYQNGRYGKLHLKDIREHRRLLSL